MAIAVKLDDLLYSRRMTLTELSDKVGITLANLSILKTGKAKGIRFATLDAICQALDCQPGDVFEFKGSQIEEEGRVVRGRQRRDDHSAASPKRSRAIPR